MLEILNLISSLVLYSLIILLIMQTKDLKKENNRLREIIKSEIEWAEMDKRTSVELAIVGERYRVSCEEFEKTCENFIKNIEKA